MALLGLPMGIMLIWLFVLGTVIGSFLNVCVYRLPRSEHVWTALRGLWSPPSHCPRCGRRIRITDNVPVLGWLWLGGRCRYCRGRISARYPLVEFFNGVLFAVVYWLEIPADWHAGIADSGLYTGIGPQGIRGSEWLSPAAVLHWRYAYHMILLEVVLVASLIDLDLTIIPDSVTVPGMLIGLIGGTVIGQVYLVPLWYQSPSVLHVLQNVLPDSWSWMASSNAVPGWTLRYPHWHGFLVSLAGLIVGAGVAWSVRILGHWVLRQEAMGFGDVTLMAAIGSFVGWQPAIIAFAIAPVFALLFVLAGRMFTRPREIPFGPYLGMATLAVILAWRHVWAVSERIFSLGPLLLPLGLFMATLLVVILQCVQLAKKLLGIPLYPDDWIEEWTSADQLAFHHGDSIDSPHCWNGRDGWPGERAGRGNLQDHDWSQGSGLG